MPRITPDQCQPLTMSELGHHSRLDLSQAKRWLSCHALSEMGAYLNSSGRAEQKTLLKAAFEHYQDNPAVTANLKQLALMRHFDLAELQPKEQPDKLVPRSARKTKAQHTLKRAMTRQRPPKTAAARTSSQHAKTPVEIEVLHNWLQQQASKGTGAAFFARASENLWALGQLRPAEVAKTLHAKGAAPELGQRLEHVTFQAMRDQVIHTLRGKLSQASNQVTLLQDRANRRSFLASSPDSASLAQDLRALGVEPQLAERCAQKSPEQDKLVTRALDQAEQGLQELASLAARSSINDKATLELFELCTPLVDKMQLEHLIRPDSFARQALDRGLARGRAQRALDNAGKLLSGVISSIVVGVITDGAFLAAEEAGAAISGGTKLLTGAAASASAAAVSGLPGLIQSAAHVHQTRAAEAQKSAAPGTTARAEEQLAQEQKSYLHSVYNSALFSPLGQLSTPLSTSASIAEDQLSSSAH